jgi:hypothetical protein
MRVLVLAAALLLGAAAGLAAIAVHRSVPGLVLGVGTALLVMWALRLWAPYAATLFAAGWLAPLLVAIGGRPEGDYVVSSDLLGWLLIVSGLVVVAAGIAWGRPLPAPRDSGVLGSRT